MAASTASGGDGLLSLSTEASGGGDEDEREWVRESGLMCGVIQTRRGSGGSRRWPARVGARRAHALLPTGRRLKTVANAGLGSARRAAYWAIEVGQVSLFLSFISCFLICSSVLN